MIFLVGGFGNQLFQLVAGMHLAKSNYHSARFSDFFLKAKLSSKTTDRLYGLGDLIPRNEMTHLSLFKVSLFRVLGLFKSSIFKIESIEYPLELDSIATNTRVILGYFQDWKYVSEIWPDLRSRISSSSSFNVLLERRTDSTKCVVIHIRLGDFRLNPSAAKNHGVSSISYYLGALEKIQAIEEIDEIFILSDEPKLAVQSFTAHYKGPLVVRDASTGDELKDLCIMTQARAIVMSNSTFSWWGSWIAYKENNAKVVFPTPWMADQNVKNISLNVPEWISFPREICDSWLLTDTSF